MSLILQALKKAEAERSVGRVPTLDQVTATEPAPPPSRRGVWAGAVVIIAVAAAVSAAWWRATSRGEPSTADAAPLPASAAASLRASASASPPSAPAVRADPQVATAPPSVQPPAPARAPSAPPPAPVPIAAGPSTTPAPAAPAPAPGRVASAPARPASVAEAALPSLHDLPASVRQALPPLPLGGSIWSPHPAERMLILGGEVRREGEAITPDLVLVTIGPRSAVLRWREQSFRLPY